MATGVVDRLKIEVTASVKNVVAEMSKASKAVKGLQFSFGNFKVQVFKATIKAIKNELKLMVTGLKALAGEIVKLAPKIASVSKGMLGLNNAIGLANKSSGSVITKFATLASRIGLIYASLFPLIRLFGGFKKLTSLASQVVEVQNVVDVSFGQMRKKIEDFSKTSIRQFGLSELSAKKYASQYQAMGRAMGITGKQVQDATKFLQKFKTPTGMTAGYDKASKSMADMSINLTKLTADMASFYNVDQQKVATALQSGIMAGNTRPLRQYGLDLTVATLEEWAHKQGIDAKVKSMSQAEKTMLRYRYVMANAANTQGDFARTSDTWANSMRILRQELEQLGIVIGKGLINAFKPFLHGLNAILEQVIAFSEKVFNSLGQIFGWKIKISTGGVATDLDEMADSTEDAEDASDGTGKNLKDAGKAAKELNKQLQGFDKLNNLTTTTKNPSGSSKSGSGKGGSGAGDGSNIGGGANDVVAKLVPTESLIKSKLDTLYKLGSFIGESLSKAMERIPWNSIYKKAEKFGSGLAEFLNGLISPRLFSNLGRTVANSINTALHFLDSFGTTFNWKNFGKSIGIGLTTFFGSVDWSKWIHVNATFGDGLAKAFNEAVANTNFKVIGSSISKYFQGLITRSFVAACKIDLNAAGEGIADGINSALQKAPFYLAGATIKLWSTKILDGLTTAIKKIKWKMIPKKIAEFVRGLSPKDISDAFGRFMDAVADALEDLTSDDKSWDFIVDSIADGINGAIDKFDSGGDKKLGKSLGKIVNKIVKLLNKINWGKLTSAMMDVIGSAIDEVDWLSLGALIGKGLLIAVANLLGKIGLIIRAIIDVLDQIAGAIYDWFVQLGKDIAKWFKDAFTFKNTKGKNGQSKITADASVTYKAFVEKAGDGWKDVDALLKDKVKDIEINVKAMVNDFKDKIKNKVLDFKAIMTKFKDSIKEKVMDFKAKMTKFKDSLRDKIMDFKAKMTTFKDSLRDKIMDFKAKMTTFKDSLKEKIINFKAKMTTFKDSLKDKLISFKAIMTKFKNEIDWADRVMKFKARLISFFTDIDWDDRVIKFQAKITSWFTDFIRTPIINAKAKFTSAFQKEGGVFSNGRWRPIQSYATGGMPSSSEVFVAREAGPELVGTIGGHTGVMNNDQIVASVSNGVAKAMAESNAILRQQNRILTNILAKEFGISSKDIFNAVRSENQNYMNRTGNNAFAL